MGMSASQMRYCMLTGRKTDIEYQGQQINQQRTTLATQSSAINEQMLTLSVPTPPSSDDYVKTVYTFNNGGTTCTLTGRVEYKKDSGTWDVYYTTSETEPQGQSAGSYYFSKETVNGETIYRNANETKLQKVVMDENDKNYNYQNAVAVANIKEDCGPFDDEEVFYWYSTTDGNKFVAESDLKENAGTINAIPTYYLNESVETSQVLCMKGCNVEYNEKNRITRITDGVGTTHDMNVKTENDEDAYDDAYNQYEYDKYEYEQKINEINAKLEVIQTQDKQLELKLSNLDTEQSAISTEMDAVKKVLDKNVESTFKTFG